MQVLRDEWTPLLQALKEKVSADARRELLFKSINDLRFISRMNFGDSGIDRPTPWQILSANYAHKFKKGNRTPNLILKGDLLRGFRTTADSSHATLTNVVEYADAHQRGLGLPERPYYPVHEDGSLTDFAEQRQAEIIKEHFKV